MYKELLSQSFSPSGATGILHAQPLKLSGKRIHSYKPHQQATGRTDLPVSASLHLHTHYASPCVVIILPLTLHQFLPHFLALSLLSPFCPLCSYPPLSFPPFPDSPLRLLSWSLCLHTHPTIPCSPSFFPTHSHFALHPHLCIFFSPTSSLSLALPLVCLSSLDYPSPHNLPILPYSPTSCVFKQTPLLHTPLPLPLEFPKSVPLTQSTPGLRSPPLVYPFPSTIPCATPSPAFFLPTP